MSIIARPGYRFAKCGHEYFSSAKQGRQRNYGDCDCKSLPKSQKAIELKCIRCGEDFTHFKFREYCSHRCAQTIALRRKRGLPVADEPSYCERCGCLIETERNGVKRCFDCQGRTLPILDPRTCPVCEETFTPVRRSQRSCSNDCAQKYWKKNYRVPEPWSDQRRARYHKRRALKRKLPADDIRPLEVYERDGWICQICYEPVDASVKWPDPKSPSLDHTVPLSKGGHHVWENVALAHLDCNVRKGDRVPVE